MKKIINIVLMTLMICCQEKKDVSIEVKGEELIAQNQKTETPKEIESEEDSTKTIAPPNAIPVKVPEIPPQKPIDCFPPKSIECKDKGGDMENGFITECLYKNYYLEEAYNAFRERHIADDEGKYLEKKMPGSKHIARFKDYPISATYTYPQQNTLKVEILFPGGVTTMIFKTEENDVIVTTNNSPD